MVLGLSVGLTLFAQDSTTHRGRKYKAPPPTSRVEVTILRNDDGKPIENAAVVFQLEGDKGNMELKTNEDGKANIDVLPTGSKVVLQVIAKGYKTFGGDYKIDKPEMTFEVKLKRPASNTPSTTIIPRRRIPKTALQKANLPTRAKRMGPRISLRSLPTNPTQSPIPVSPSHSRLTLAGSAGLQSPRIAKCQLSL